MSSSITKEQFEKRFKLLIESSKKKWQFTTDLAIADKIAEVENKEQMVEKIEELLKQEMTEKEFMERLKVL